MGRRAPWLLARKQPRRTRWNSWDALTRPLDFGCTVIGQFVDAGPHPHPVPVTLIFGGGLVIGYVALWVLATPARAELSL